MLLFCVFYYILFCRYLSYLNWWSSCFSFSTTCVLFCVDIPLLSNWVNSISDFGWFPSHSDIVICMKSGKIYCKPLWMWEKEVVADEEKWVVTLRRKLRRTYCYTWCRRIGRKINYLTSRTRNDHLVLKESL